MFYEKTDVMRVCFAASASVGWKAEQIDFDRNRYYVKYHNSTYILGVLDEAFSKVWSYAIHPTQVDAARQTLTTSDLQNKNEKKAFSYLFNLYIYV